MNSDLESELRAAMAERAELVTSERLGRPARISGRDQTSRRSAWKIVAPVLAAACVVAIAAAVTLVVIGRSPRQPAAASGTSVSDRLAGTSWRLTSVRQGSKVTAIVAVKDAAKTPAGVQFYPGGRFYAQDTVNFAGGHYHLASPTMIVFDYVDQTTAALASTDPQRIAAVAGMTAVTLPTKTGPARVTVSYTPATLTLSANGFTCVFTRTVQTSSAASASS